MVASFPEVKHLPIVIGESDPEGCAACGMHTNPENAYRNGTMYSSYTAASFARKYALADSMNVHFLGAVSWSFEFENQPWFYGFRDLSTNGVNKPVLNVFRMFGMMQGQRVGVRANRMYDLKTMVDSSVRGPHEDVGAFATKDKNTAAIMVWNYHDDDTAAPAKPVEVNVHNLPVAFVTLTHYRIDDKHSNAYEVWKKMGSPQNPTAAQIKILEKSGQLEMIEKPKKLSVKNGMASITMNLPRQGVSLLKMDW